MTQACYRPFMKQKYGKVVNLGSVSGLLGTAGQANYAASKAGVMALTKVTARELASRGVTCNAIAPGFIATDMTKEISEEATKNYLASIPVGRAGTPEDVANLAAFLASPESDYITGTVIRIDGGLAIS
jgi:3-oxoacyl-[acyl-carrier protein] reductase